jgi:hypothetical protein
MSTTDNIQKRTRETASRDVIEQYLIAGGEGVELSSEQQWMLARWTFIDKKLSQGELKRSEICAMVMKLYNVSRDTAFRDMVNTEHVMASSYPQNKKYQLGLAIEDYKKYIREAAEDRDWKNVAALGKVVTSMWAIYPDASPAQSPRTLIFQVLQQNITTESKMSVDEAMAFVDAELAKPLDDE